MARSRPRLVWCFPRMARRELKPLRERTPRARRSTARSSTRSSRAGGGDRQARSLAPAWAHHRLTVHPASWPRPDSEGTSLSASTSATLRTRAGRRGNDRHRRPPLASLAPHQPRPARDAADAVERGGVIRWSGSSSGAYAVLVQQVHDVLRRNDVGEPNTEDARITDST